MVGNELFNQDLLGQLDPDIRFAVGIPGAEGCNNIKQSVLFPLIAGYIIRSGSAAVVAGSNVITFSSDFETAAYSLLFFDQDGAGISVISQDNLGFEIDCLSNGDINYLAIKNI